MVPPHLLSAKSESLLPNLRNMRAPLPENAHAVEGVNDELVQDGHRGDLGMGKICEAVRLEPPRQLPRQVFLESWQRQRTTSHDQVPTEPPGSNQTSRPGGCEAFRVVLPTLQFLRVSCAKGTN